MKYALQNNQIEVTMQAENENNDAYVQAAEHGLGRCT